MLSALRLRAFPSTYTIAAAAGIGLLSTSSDFKVRHFTVQADASVTTESPAPSESVAPAKSPTTVETPTPPPAPTQAVAPAIAPVSAPTPASAPAESPVTTESPSLAAISAPAPAPVEVPEPPAPKLPRLTPKDWTPLTLLEKSQLNHNTWFFKFEAVPNEDGSPLFPTASCLMIKSGASAGSMPVVRPYTPINRESENESVDLVIKVYPTGKMGNYMKGLGPGDTLDFKGPFVKYPLKANAKKKIGLLAAGTGITPMLQVAQKIVEDPEDNTEVTLIFANITEDDILVKSQLDALQASSNGQFKVYYVVEHPRFAGVFWKGGRGRVSKYMIEKLMPPPGDDHLVMVCGPPGFMEAVSGNKSPDRSQGELKGFLKDLGYTPEQVFKF